MKYFGWGEEKNQKLKETREISFEEIVKAIEENHVLDRIDHPNKSRYPNQKIMIIEINEYAYLVPFVEDKEKIFFKTIIPSRKMTKKYLIQEVRKR